MWKKLLTLAIAATTYGNAASSCGLANWSPGFVSESQPLLACASLPANPLDCQTLNHCCYSQQHFTCVPSNLLLVDCPTMATSSACLQHADRCKWNGSHCLRVCPFTSNPQMLCMAVVSQIGQSVVTKSPSRSPTFSRPTSSPTTVVTRKPTLLPTTLQPTMQPVFTRYPTIAQYTEPPLETSTPSQPVTTRLPTHTPTSRPTWLPTTKQPIGTPTIKPTKEPSTKQPTGTPTTKPTKEPSTKQPTGTPTIKPTKEPSTKRPTSDPTFKPTKQPTDTPKPTLTPTLKPIVETTVAPTSKSPSTLAPSKIPTAKPTRKPTAQPTAKPIAGKKTNFVILLADDLGYGDVSFNGGFKTTPHLMEMSLASNTVKLTNFHSASPVCSPSRAAMLSGQYPDRNCVSGPQAGLYFQAQNNTPTIAQDAKQAGYSTLFLGKWHITAIDNDFIGKSGFDSWTGSYGNIMTFDAPCMCGDVECKLDCNAAKHCLARKVNSVSYCYNADNACEPGPENMLALQTTGYPAFFECGMKMRRAANVVVNAGMPRQMMACDFLVDKFQDFLVQRDINVPFLAVLNFHEVHRPFVADPTMRKQCEQGSKTCTVTAQRLGENSVEVNYYSVLESLDASIGRVRDLLRKYKLDKDTFVLFTSDNGPERFEQGGAGSAGPFQGMKRSLWEGGHRVPALIESTKWIPDSLTQSNALISLLDLRPTIRAILEAENPRLKLKQEDTLDGVSLLPLFASSARAAPWKRDKDVLVCMQVLYQDVLNGKRARLCDTYAYMRENWKIIVTRDSETKNGKLFNLDVDLGETNNLSAKQSAIFSTLVQAGKAMVQDVFARYNTVCGGFIADTQLDPLYGSTPYGQEYEN